MDHLRYIAAEEGVSAEEQALFEIGRQADGALRDALSLFDRLNNQLEGQINYQQVISSLGMVDIDRYFQLTDHILTENPAGLLMSTTQLVNRGYEMEVIMQGLANHFRQLLYFQYPSLEPVISIPDSIKDRYRQQAALCF